MTRTRFSRRDFLRMTGATTGLVLLAACGSGGGGQQATGTDAPAASAREGGASPGAEPTTLITNNQYFNTERYPTYPHRYRAALDAGGLDWLTIEHEQVDDTALEPRMAAGDAPDIIFLYPELALPWAARNQLVDLTSSIDADAEWKADHDAFIASMLDGYRLDTALYGIPFAAEAQACSYIAHHFEEAGVETPNEVGADAFTFEKFREMNLGLAEAGFPGFFAHTGFNSGLGDIVTSMGGNYFSEDGTRSLVNEPGFVAAVEFQYQLLQDGGAVDGIQLARDGQWVAAALSNELASTIIAGDWAWGWAHKTNLEGGLWDPIMFYIPSGSAGRRAIAHSAGQGAYTTSGKRDAQMAFLKFSMTQAYQQIGAELYEEAPLFPSRLDAVDPIFERDLLPEFFPTLFEGTVASPATPVLNPYPIFGYMDDAFAQLWSGADTRPVQVVMDALHERVQADLDASSR